MRTLGQNPSADELQKIMDEADVDKNGTIEFEEFLILMAKKSTVHALHTVLLSLLLELPSLVLFKLLCCCFYCCCYCCCSILFLRLVVWNRKIQRQGLRKLLQFLIKMGTTFCQLQRSVSRSIRPWFMWSWTYELLPYEFSLQLLNVMLNLGERMTIDEVDDMIHEADTDRDGRISYEEFRAMMMETKLQ